MSMYRNGRSMLRRVLAALALSALLGSGAAVADGGVLAGLGQKLGFFKQQPSFLPPDEAFSFTADVRDAGTVVVRWRIADGYYLYRDRFAFRLQDSPQYTLGEPGMPAGGEFKEDEFFGRMEVYYRDVEVVLPIEREAGAAKPVRIEASYQGCAEAGFCYPPMSKAVELQLPPV